MCTPVSTISLYPASTRRLASLTTSLVGVERGIPLVNGMMQKVQKSLHPSSTLTIARVRCLKSGSVSGPAADDGRWTMDDAADEPVSLPPSSIVHRPSSRSPPAQDGVRAAHSPA